MPGSSHAVECFRGSPCCGLCQPAFLRGGASLGFQHGWPLWGDSWGRRQLNELTLSLLGEGRGMGGLGRCISMWAPPSRDLQLRNGPISFSVPICERLQNLNILAPTAEELRKLAACLLCARPCAEDITHTDPRLTVTL